MINQIHQ